MTGYTVLRAKREFANQSSIGFMGTSTNRQIVTNVSFLADNAFTGGVDYDWRFGPQVRLLRVILAGSHITGQHRSDHAPAGEQRPLVPAARRRLRRIRSACDARCAAMPDR